jgi:hypothetical protein
VYLLKQLQKEKLDDQYPEPYLIIDKIDNHNVKPVIGKKRTKIVHRIKLKKQICHLKMNSHPHPQHNHNISTSQPCHRDPVPSNKRDASFSRITQFISMNLYLLGAIWNI